MSNGKKNIVIVGGSYAGLSVAHNILKHTLPILPDADSYKVTVISSSAQAMCRPGTPRALISDHFFDRSEFFVDIAEQFNSYPTESFSFIQGNATALDLHKRALTYRLPSKQEEQLTYYALVIATGSSTPSPLFSFNDSDSLALRSHWTAFRAALPSAKSIVISGGGATGVETAGELAEYLNGRPRWYNSLGFGRPEQKVSVKIITAGSKLLPILRSAIAHQGEQELESLGVSIMKNTRVTSVSPSGAGTTDVGTKAKVTCDNGDTLEADLYIPCTGSKPNTSFVPPSMLAEDGRVKVEPSTMRVPSSDGVGDRVYAIGDASTFARPAVHLLFDAVPVLAANIKRDFLLAAGPDGEQQAAALKGGKEDCRYEEDKRETHLVPIGTATGVGSAMGYKVPSFAVWLIKGRDYWLSSTPSLWNGKMWEKEKF